MTPSVQARHTLRAAHAIHLVDLVKRWDVSGDMLLAGTGIRHDTIADPQARLTVPMMVPLLERARRLTDEPALGLHIGLNTRPTLYGHLGFAVMSASTIREAIEISLRYGRIVTTALSVRFRADKRVAALIFDEHADFGSARDIALMTTLVAFWQVSRCLTGRDLTTSTLEFAMPEPSYARKLEMAGVRARFNRPVNQLTFDARSLDMPYTMPDPIAAKLAREQCQRELDAIGMGAGLTDRVRALIAKPEGGIRGLDEVATAMNRSGRTLKRQLQAHGVSFSALRDGELHARAMVLLRTHDLSLAEVAARLGYSSVTSFERAFHRWTGITPAQCRRRETNGAAPQA